MHLDGGLGTILLFVVMLVAPMVGGVAAAIYLALRPAR